MPPLRGARRGLAAALLCAASCAAVKLPAEVPARVADQIQQLFGNASDVVEVLPPDSRLPAESFEVECDGTGSTVRGGSRLGALYGLFELAKAAGFGFLHPLHVVAPVAPNWCHTLKGAPSSVVAGPARAGQAVRGTHVHTQHPIELANVLNGVGQAPGGGPVSEDEAAWAAGLPQWSQYLQWLVANKQNLVEWALLEWGPANGGFSTSPVRQRRLAEVVLRAHEWGLQVAIDAPFNLQQQHAWRIQSGNGSWPEFLQRLDWLCELGLDVISTEIGTTEFSHTDPKKTIQLLNRTTAYLANRSKLLLVKNHASSHQVAKGYKDPLDPQHDVNFNYITYYADRRVLSAPHTVQMYSLADPLAGSYGRRNYSDIRAMMALLDNESRPEVFFPETAYWVDFDISVPIFLPLYASDRLRDLQLIAREAPHAGHLNFESGWAFGYWINNAAQALAAWSHGEHGGVPMTPKALFDSLLAPLKKEGKKLSSILVELARLQNESLVYDPFQSPTGAWHSLVGYIEGWDGMAEFQEAFQIAVVQPPRVHPREVAAHSDWYLHTLAPRLRALSDASGKLAAQCRELRAAAAPGSASTALVQDACIGVELFALRVQQVGGIYAAASGAAPESGLLASANAIQEGLSLIQGLALQPEWTTWTGTPVPTAYPYGYLWPAATLFFWRRDHQIVAHGIREACYLNLYDPVEIGLPHTVYKTLLRQVSRFAGRFLSWLPWVHSYAGCLFGPLTEPVLDPADKLPTATPTMPPEHVYF